MSWGYEQVSFSCRDVWQRSAGSHRVAWCFPRTVSLALAIQVGAREWKERVIRRIFRNDAPLCPHLIAAHPTFSIAPVPHGQSPRSRAWLCRQPLCTHRLRSPRPSVWVCGACCLLALFPTPLPRCACAHPPPCDNRKKARRGEGRALRAIHPRCGGRGARGGAAGGLDRRRRLLVRPWVAVSAFPTTVRRSQPFPSAGAATRGVPVGGPAQGAPAGHSRDLEPLVGWDPDMIPSQG